MATPSTEELQAFMAAIREQESNNNYGAFGKPTGDSRGVARGAYQIMSGYWDDWARQAGYAGADWRVPELQDKVAEFKFRQYYDRYDGRWDLVALAWFGGPGRADEAEKRGVEIYAGVTDNLGKGIPDYVADVMGKFQARSPNATSRPQIDENQNATAQGGQAFTFGDVQAQKNQQQTQRQMTDERALAQASFDQISKFIRANAGNPEAHEAMRRAMGNFFGTAGPTADGTVATASTETESAPKPPSVEEEERPDTVPGSAPGIGQSGVR